MIEGGNEWSGSEPIGHIACLTAESPRRTPVFSLLLFCSADAQSEVQSPKAGSPLRAALIDAIRTAMEPELEEQMSFKVDHLAVLNQ